MHFIVTDICNQNGCLVLVMFQWFKYRTNPNSATPYTEKSQTFKNDLNPFLSFEFHNDWLQNHCWLSLKSMAHNFVVVVCVLLPLYCHIGSGMPYMCIFVEEVVPLLGPMADK